MLEGEQEVCFPFTSLLPPLFPLFFSDAILRICITSLTARFRLIRAAKKDPATAKLIADSQKLIKDISNKKGTGILDPQLLNEIRAVIVPVIVDHLDNAPLPDFHGYAETALGKYDYTLSGIRLGTSGLVPSKVKVQFLYKAIADPSKLKVDQQHTYMYLEVNDIQVSFKDVKWHYNRNTIPRFSDSGTVDLTTAGKVTSSLPSPLSPPFPLLPFHLF